MIWVALCVAIVVAVLGIAMSAIALPGIWFMLACAIVTWLIVPEAIGPWPLGFIALLGAMGELVDFLASALGVKRAGGSRAGAWGSVIGTLVGAIGCSFIIPIPFVGSVIGGVVGAGSGAFFAERMVSKRTWRDSAKSGQGAAIGRLISMIVKLMLAGAAAATLVSVVAYNAISTL